MRKKYVFLVLPLVLFTCLAGMEISKKIHDQTEKPTIMTPVAAEINSDLLSEPVTFGMDTNVLLKVDTENITQDNYDGTVEITDDRSNSSEVSRKPSEHVALVDKNMKIYWRAEPLDPQLGVTVDVLGIFRKTEGGAEILENVFRDPNQDGIVMGKIKNKNIDGLEYYNILIRVNGETPETYVIDPKLKMSGD